MQNLYSASDQWAKRPADERFWGVEDALQAAHEYHRGTGVSDPLTSQDLRVESVDGSLRALGTSGIPVQLSHLAFGQLAGLVGAPANYLRELPATLAAQNINHGLKTRGDANPLRLLCWTGDEAKSLQASWQVHAITSTKYTRIWNWEVLERAKGLVEQGWRVPPARHSGHGESRIATQADVLKHIGAGGGAMVQVGDTIGPAGVYVWQGGMYALLVNDSKPIEDSPGSPLFRATIIENAETGTGAFKLTTLWLRGVCGNHILWGVEQQTEWSVRHVGQRARTNAWAIAAREIAQINDTAASVTEGHIQGAKLEIFGGTKDQVLDKLFGARVASRKQLEAGYDAAYKFEDNLDPRSRWGMLQGLTRASQAAEFAEDRLELDRAAAKVMRIRI